MRPRESKYLGLLLCVTFAVGAAAQEAPRITAVDPQFEQASVDRGQQTFVNQCGFCHGSNARGGSSGPDLTRSELVQSDEGGKQFGEFLRAVRESGAQWQVPTVLFLNSSDAALRASGLVQPGSVVRWHYRLRLPDNDVSDAAVHRVTAAAQAQMPEAGWDIRSRSNASPALEQNV